MKLKEILKRVGGAVIKEAIPGGALIVDTVNEFLPDNKQLPYNASSIDLDQAIASLPANQQTAILAKEFDVEIVEIRETSATLQAMLASDATNPHSTRPYIAKASLHIVGFVVIVVVSSWAYAVIKGDTKTVTAIVNGWPFVLGAIAPFTVLLQAYFGVLRNESRDKLNAANGLESQNPLGSIVKSFINRG